MSKKKRPGVEAGMNLISLDSAETWEKVEERTNAVICSIPNLSKQKRSLDDLRDLDKNFITKAELDLVVLWKHTVGKKRPYNIKLLNGNSDHSVKIHSKEAIALAREIELEDCLEEDGSLTPAGGQSIQEAIMELGKLKGVGPATASAVLTLVRPDVFCYLYDEAIDSIEPLRDYKISNYLRVNARCVQIAQRLGDKWTTSRVVRAIWTASRYLAIHGEDLTKDESSTLNGKSNGKRRPAVSEDEDRKPAVRSSKRQRRGHQ